MHSKIKQLEKTNHRLTKHIITNTSDWDLYQWKLFRSLNNYWDIRDNYTIELNRNLKNRRKYLILDIKFKEWKLKEINKFNKLL